MGWKWGPDGMERWASWDGNGDLMGWKGEPDGIEMVA